MKEGVMLFDQEWADIDAGHDWVVANANKDESLEYLLNLYALACIEYFTIRLHPQQRIAWLEPALAAARLLNDVKAESSHLAGLGIAYYDWGDPRRAMKYHKRSLTIAQKLKNCRAEAGARPLVPRHAVRSRLEPTKRPARHREGRWRGHRVGRGTRRRARRGRPERG